MAGAWCFGCCQTDQDLPVGLLLLRYSVLCNVVSLSLLYPHFISWFICFMRWCMAELWGLSYKPNIYVSWSTSELRVRLVPGKRSKPSSKIFFTDRSKAVLLLWIFYVFFCLVFVMLLCTSVCWCPVVTCWERAASWLSFVMSICDFVTFPLVSWVRCGAWLYRFLIFALFLLCCMRLICYIEKGLSFQYQVPIY